MSTAQIHSQQENGQFSASLTGAWVLAELPTPISQLEDKLRAQSANQAHWNLQTLERLDSAGAFLLWRAWGKQWPAALDISARHREIIERVAKLPPASAPAQRSSPFAIIETVGMRVFRTWSKSGDIVTLVGQLILDVFSLFSRPHDIPWREFSANLYKSGAQALPVTALVGFLIGLVLSFLSSLQLKAFGADIYIVNLLGISIVRELGPVLVAVLVAGRSGSAMTAQIGVMRVTQELDALATMGISRSLRLILPKVLALAIAGPLLVLWCSGMAIFGGMVAAKFEMGLDYNVFLNLLQKSVPPANLWIGLGKGVLFGVVIALIACYYGLKVRPNTESLSANTTTAVVTAITMVIIVDAFLALLTRSIGMP